MSYSHALKTPIVKERPPTLEEIELKYHTEPPHEVVLDMMVALKIAQHSRQNLHIPVTGQVLGLEIDNVLHVTDSFPLPNEDEGTDSKHYALDMLKCLDEVNVDNDTIGWYRSNFLNVHMKFLIETQYGYQSETPESVVITYDPFVASHANGFNAFRLNDRFMKLWKDNTFSREKLAELNFTFEDIFDEVPIVLRTTSGLAQAFVSSVQNDPQIEDQYEHLELSTNDFMHKNFEALSFCLQDLQREQSIYDNWQRNIFKLEHLQQEFLQERKAVNATRLEAGEPLLPESIKQLEIENPMLFKKPAEPQQLDTLLFSHTINVHCDQIIQFAGQSLTKQFVTKGLSDL